MVDTASDKLMKSLKENWTTIIQDGDDDDKNEEAMKALAERVCKAEFEHYVFLDNLKNAARLETFEAFEEATIEPLSSQKNRFKSKDSKRYQTFVKDLNHVTAQNTVADPAANTSSSEVFTMTDTVNEIDPITKGPLEDPVRNRHCKHIYGKRSIIESIQMNPRTRCPILGCGNQKKITLDDLVDDEEYARKLQHQRLTQADSMA